MPLIAYKDRSLLVVSKLWGPRLSPGKMSADVQWALEEAHLHLPSTCHEALCYVAWSFQANPTDELDWDFYQFTFHESLESTSHPDFNKVAEYWSKLGGAKVEANEVEFYWKQTIVGTCFKFTRVALIGILLIGGTWDSNQGETVHQGLPILLV